ncbi:aminotransferase class I/II-fold pyridoxal phosphate-dependent enzyme [Streptomyces sp. LP05-1]|uniref:cysteine-S-conjugate beta-lyase n=1 Tax=Streptomyces pyxinae TaxID=2970734 RepID=A0ABT2CBW2_9ACTN|nr:aminotransferase class I/II-fold pyridoxal phosphate-dependent enzyme [Streptomyces sp. LP05-1]MCS0634868.1 aminotransferase class I/II-fold pyridoxal phosphate-dependent enzyme [Streptomyces sp. LP05-1]
MEPTPQPPRRAPEDRPRPGADPDAAPGHCPDPFRELSLADLRRRASAKWRVYPPDVLPLWIAEMDVPLAEPVARALTEAVALGDTGYAVGGPYGKALAAFAADRWGWHLAAERTAMVPDVMQGIVEVLKLITGPGDPVVVNSPVYEPFYLFTGHLGRRVVEAPLGPGHRVDPERLADTFRRVTAGGGRAAYLLCSPHNPTGTVHTAEELATVAALAGRYGVRVVADEIHAPLVAPGVPFVPYLTVPGTEDAFALLSASKAWNLAGAKAALAVAGPGAAADLARLPPEVSHGPSHLGVLAHTAALREGGPWLDAVLRALDAHRKLLTGLLAERLPGVRYTAEPGTYLAWLDCRGLGLGDDPAAVFLEHGRVALTPGHVFGTGGAGHARLNLAASPEVITEAVHRMAAAAEATAAPGRAPAGGSGPPSGH